jgi:hypothetical protein
VIALAAVLSGCGGGNAPAPAPAEADTTVTGRVRVAGSTPLQQVMIQPEDSSQAELEVVGEYRAELERLSGAVVQATGTLSDGGRLSVTRYEILEVAGHVPLVGTVEVRRSDVTLVTEDGDRVKLLHVPGLLTMAGAKVWVIRDPDGVVTGYGVIRER